MSGFDLANSYVPEYEAVYPGNITKDLNQAEAALRVRGQCF